MKFLIKIGAILGFPRCIPSGSIAAKNVALFVFYFCVVDVLGVCVCVLCSICKLGVVFKDCFGNFLFSKMPYNPTKFCTYIHQKLM